MGILNATPDSFSDGGQHFELDDAMEYARRCVHESADIIDIGGYSTRPGALEISPEEEIRRVSSVIQRIRSEGNQIPISVDTFRASVAQAAIQAGADMINDVYALAHDPEICETARQLGVPVVLMHSRGDAGKNKEYEGSVVDVVREELGAKVKKALDSGIRRWNIIVDPGIGFSKSVEDNCTLLREHSALTSSPPLTSMPPRHRTLREAWEANKKTPMRNMPTLVGSSRKSFLGTLLGQGNSAPVPARERGWATAATISAAIQQGSDIIRVHDVKEMRQVKIVADAIWRAAKRVL
jgi:dihydroneopterin aldolase/2-amino-4-hydroxy-6-hydroxymethyldihydropteridine diphosphokinase/dihydropteroate synthase